MEISELLAYLKTQLESVDNAGTIYASPVTDLPPDCAKFRGENDMRGAELHVGTVQLYATGGNFFYEVVPISIYCYMSEKCGAKYGEFVDYCSDFARQVAKSFPTSAPSNSNLGGFFLDSSSQKESLPISLRIGKTDIFQTKTNPYPTNTGVIDFRLRRVIQRHLL